MLPATCNLHELTLVQSWLYCVTREHFMEWMVVEFSLEEQLAVETQARVALNHSDSKEVAQLCATLIKQNAHQSKLLSQAVRHVARLEAIMCFTHLTRPWWKRIF